MEINRDDYAVEDRMATFGFVRATTTRFHEPRGQYRQTRNERDFGMDVERRQCSGKEGHSLVDEDEFRQKYRVSSRSSFRACYLTAVRALRKQATRAQLILSEP